MGLAAALGALLGSQAPAQDAAQEAASPAPTAEESAAVDEVVVRGRRMSEVEFDLHDYVRTFVNEITATPRGRGYARWHRDVCVGVHNVREDAAQYIADRISLLAAEVGLKPGKPGCRPDVMIVFTTSGIETAAAMVENQPRLFEPNGGLGGMNLVYEDLKEFTVSDRPIRWWHVSMPVDSRTGNRAIIMAGDENPPVISVGGIPSHLQTGIRDDMWYVIVVVDATKLLGKTWQQLGDYLAVVSLAQIDANADLSAFDSILNLFENPQAYSGLTDWDRSYMRALYGFNQERVPEIQSDDLVSRMARQETDADENGAN
jgi:hypothetical protein